MRPEMTSNQQKGQHRHQNSFNAPLLIETSDPLSDHAAKGAKEVFGSERGMLEITGVCIGAYIIAALGMFVGFRSSFSGKSSGEPWVDAVYFSIVTITTVGYGDITPRTSVMKLWTCAFVLIGIGFIGLLLSAAGSYLLDKQEAMMLQVAEQVASMDPNMEDLDLMEEVTLDPTGMYESRARVRVRVALLSMITVILAGMIGMIAFEDMSIIDAFYCACISASTVGYGDFGFSTLYGRMFGSVWLLTSTLTVGRSLLVLAGARLEAKQQELALMQLKRKLSKADVEAADFDDDGQISETEYIIFKLKEMGKINDSDINNIRDEFRAHDMDKSGKIEFEELVDE